MKNARILGTGSYLPENNVTNDELSKTVDTSDEWIFKRSGIKSRHIADTHETTSDMALQASLKALEVANIGPQDLGGIIVATTTPDLTFPSTAAIGILSTHLHADGRHACLLQTSGGPSSNGEVGKLTMEGKEVFKFAVDARAGAVREAMEENNLSADDIDWLVPHQANIRIIEATAKKLNMSMDHVVTTLENQGNTSAASIPLALDHAIKSGDIKRGQTLLLEAMGGGFTWGAALIQY